MEFKDFLASVEYERGNNWRNSDMEGETHHIFTNIALHVRHCDICVKNLTVWFDSNTDENLFELEEYFFNTKLEDWICDQPKSINGKFKAIGENKTERIRMTTEEKLIIENLRLNEGIICSFDLYKQVNGSYSICIYEEALNSQKDIERMVTGNYPFLLSVILSYKNGAEILDQKLL